MHSTPNLKLARQDLSRTYLAHHELESVVTIIIIIIIIINITARQMDLIQQGLQPCYWHSNDAQAIVVQRHRLQWSGSDCPWNQKMA